MSLSKNKNYARKDRKGILFVAIFRHREFTKKRICRGYKCLSYDDFAIWTNADYFIILYRYSHGRFLQISRMQTDFSYNKPQKYNLEFPAMKDLTGTGIDLK